MEDDEEDSPLPSADQQQTEIKDAARGGDMSLTRTVPCRQILGPVSFHRSLPRAVGFGFLSTPSGSSEDSQALFHNLFFDPGFVPHRRTSPEESGDDEQQDEGTAEQRRDEDQEETSMEVQIGRRLRQIGDQFQREHMQPPAQDQRDRLAGLWRLVATLHNLILREVFGHGGRQR